MANYQFIFEAAEDASEDAEYRLVIDGQPSSFAIQVGGCAETAGYYFVTEYGPDEDFWSRIVGEFRSLAKAKAAALEAAGL